MLLGQGHTAEYITGLLQQSGGLVEAAFDLHLAGEYSSPTHASRPSERQTGRPSGRRIAALRGSEGTQRHTLPAPN